jgi:thymidylate synthase (FAD)
MFEGEPHVWDDVKGVVPQVTLLTMTDRPLSAVAAMSEMYKGRVVRDLDELDEATIRKAFEDVQNTHLTAPLEAIKFHFMIEGVDRAFTHQMVRQRTAVYAQESQRFCVIDDLPHAVSLPPSLFGTPENADPMSSKQAERWRHTWDYVLDVVAKGYGTLVADGMPQEDARGLLPHATATRLNFITDMRNLVDHAGNRLCTQAQFHWRTVFSQMINAIREYAPPSSFAKDDWQFVALADSALWRPVCYRLGHCPFKASFDRFCSIRDRVELLGSHGIKGIDIENPDVAGEQYINPAEWMLVPDAARTVD